jgi:hypothetical protein
VTKTKAYAERKRLEGEFKLAGRAKAETAHERDVAANAVKALSKDRAHALADAARGNSDAGKRADELRGEIATNEATFRDAEERIKASNHGQKAAKKELHELLVAELATFAAGADKLADEADAAREEAAKAITAAAEAEGHARREWQVLVKACRDHEVAGVNLGPMPTSKLSEALGLVSSAQRCEPANADEARRPGIIGRAFRWYRHTTTGQTNQVRVGSPAEDNMNSVNDSGLGRWEPVDGASDEPSVAEEETSTGDPFVEVA